VADDIIDQLAHFVPNEQRMPAGLIVDTIQEIERLRAEVEQLTSRSCLTCVHGSFNPKYDLNESGVTCNRINIVFRHDFYCARWEECHEQ
jgi:hypothetical protein